MTLIGREKIHLITCMKCQDKRPYLEDLERARIREEERKAIEVYVNKIAGYDGAGAELR